MKETNQLNDSQVSNSLYEENIKNPQTAFSIESDNDEYLYEMKQQNKTENSNINNNLKENNQIYYQPLNTNTNLFSLQESAQNFDIDPHFSQITNNNLNSNDINSLMLKITNQNKIISELQNYKTLCEKHILQFSPGHRLPIIENDIISFKNNPNIYNNEMIAHLSEEKEKIEENLRQEILLNEEQRNLIEILKQSIESEIIKR